MLDHTYRLIESPKVQWSNNSVIKLRVQGFVVCDNNDVDADATTNRITYY